MKQCPNCRLTNPPSAARCDCGYEFPVEVVDPAGQSGSPEAERRDGSRGRALKPCPACGWLVPLGIRKCTGCGKSLLSHWRLMRYQWGFQTLLALGISCWVLYVVDGNSLLEMIGFPLSVVGFLGNGVCVIAKWRQRASRRTDA